MIQYEDFLSRSVVGVFAKLEVRCALCWRSGSARIESLTIHGTGKFTIHEKHQKLFHSFTLRGLVFRQTFVKNGRQGKPHRRLETLQCKFHLESIVLVISLNRRTPYSLPSLWKKEMAGAKFLVFKGVVEVPKLFLNHLHCWLLGDLVFVLQ